MELNELREKIDQVDRQIVALYEERMVLSRGVAEYKIEKGLRVLDKAREREKLAALKALTKDDFNAHGVEELFAQLMAMSRKLQYEIIAKKGARGHLPFTPVDNLDKDNARVVYQGDAGSYSQQAMFSFFKETVNSFHVETFRDAMCAIEEGSADYAVLPIENSTAGIVNENYDLLSEFENYIVGEQIIKIEHCLMAKPGTSFEDIKTVYSHPQSLMQSQRFLYGYPQWQQVGMKNNAFAAKLVSEEKDPTIAAIAGEAAAKAYGLNILKKGVNQAENNSTRFIIVTNQKIFRKDAEKISICFEIPNESGSLYRILSHFIYNNLNMCKIESRPIEERNFEYRFFVDFDGNFLEAGVRNALRGLREEARNLRILGNY
ncbi:MAG: prephenate dehydratase [Lachnospiraceae bacterium]|nr:prephenate dehydratase [Lachnospiraceae bacterium]